MERPVNSIELVAMDTESTGLDRGSRLVEIGGLKFLGTEVRGTFLSTLINPEIPIPPQVTAIHHITDQMVARSPTADVVLKDFLAFCQDSILIAHNAPFDMRMVAGEIDRLGWPMPNICFLDTCKLARLWIPHLERFSLEKVSRYFGLKIGTLHRAYDDALLVKEIFLKVTALVADKKGEPLLLNDLLKGGNPLYLGAGRKNP